MPRHHKRRSQRKTGPDDARSASAQRGGARRDDDRDASASEESTHAVEDGSGSPPADRASSYGPLESVARRPLLALLPVLVLVSIAVLYSVARAPIYSAEARLLVGSLARNFTPAAGLVDANQELTDIYSRVVGSPAHLDLMAQLGVEVPPDSIDASPVPKSPFIRVEATAETQEEAIRRADAAASALADYGAALRTQALERDNTLLTDLDSKGQELAAARLDTDAKQDTYNTLNATAATAAQLEAARAALVEAEGKEAAAQLEFEALREQYTASETATRGGIELNEFSDAEPLGSDRRSTFALTVAIAALIGALIGAALATLSANHWRILPSELTEETDGGGDSSSRSWTLFRSNVRRTAPAEVEADTTGDAKAPGIEVGADAGSSRS